MKFCIFILVLPAEINNLWIHVMHTRHGTIIPTPVIAAYYAVMSQLYGHHIRGDIVLFCLQLFHVSKSCRLARRFAILENQRQSQTISRIVIK